MLIFFEVKTMFYVGIDAAKDKHYAIVCDEKGKTLVKAFPFANNAEGFCTLQKNFPPLTKTSFLSVLNQPEFIPRTLFSSFSVVNSLSSKTRQPGSIDKREEKWYNRPPRKLVLGFKINDTTDQIQT